ncbi:MAG: hypothetical protein S4CHLAM7_05790 [Chlamydiae bacterium]|nr:hypothetical protein [Chlamydiota bacterium]
MFFRKKTHTTSKTISDLCPIFLQKMTKSCDQRMDLILIAWPDIIGPKLAPMTKAHRFYEGVLEVRVSNSTLLSILTFKEKIILLKKIREKFPKAAIKDILFRIG